MSRRSSKNIAFSLSPSSRVSAAGGKRRRVPVVWHSGALTIPVRVMRSRVVRFGAIR